MGECMNTDSSPSKELSKPAPQLILLTRIAAALEARPSWSNADSATRFGSLLSEASQELARYESGRVVLLGEIEELKKKLSARLQQIEELRMAERLNVETVARLQQERDELARRNEDLRHSNNGWLEANGPGGWIDHLRSHHLRTRGGQPPPDGPEGLLHALEVLRQRWSHNVNFEATIGACKEEIELCMQRAGSTKPADPPGSYRDATGELVIPSRPSPETTPPRCEICFDLKPQPWRYLCDTHEAEFRAWQSKNRAAPSEGDSR